MLYEKIRGLQKYEKNGDHFWIAFVPVCNNDGFHSGFTPGHYLLLQLWYYHRSLKLQFCPLYRFNEDNKQSATLPTGRFLP